MPVPLTVALPAAAASLAYLNARTQFSGDCALISAIFKQHIEVVKAERRDRINLYYILEEHAKAKSTSNQAFFIYGGITWTYEEVYDIVLKYGTWLKTTHGIMTKEVVALDFMNSPKLIFIWLAIWSLGACPAFINYNLTDQPLVHCVEVSTARIIFADDEIRSKFSPDVLDALATADSHGKGSVEVVYLDEALEKEILTISGIREPDALRSGPKATDISMLIYTSGTTGLPKAAIVPWRKLYGGGAFLQKWLGWKRKDRFYTCMPLYHSTATILGFVPCLFIGSTIIIGHKFSNATFWPEVRASNATIIQYVGETCRYLLAAPALLDPRTGENIDRKNNVRVAFGNGLRPDIWEKFKDRFGIETIAEFYAATEGSSASWNIASNTLTTGAIGRYGTLARMLLGSRQAVVELDWETESPKRYSQNHNFCTRVSLNTPGELLYAINAANIKENFPGYLNNEKANDSKTIYDVFTKGDAWFRTGDVVKFDVDGLLWFCDRVGDTFRWKSENVSTNEVAEALGVHPAIVEANVYGVEVPNHDGRAGCVAMVFNQDLNQKLLDSVASHVRAKLPKYAVPIFLRVTKTVRSTGNNKQQKVVLRSQGVELEKVTADGDQLYWLKDGAYVKFTEEDLKRLKEGKIRL